MNIKKQKCLRCEGRGCVECAWSGVIYKNIEFEEKDIVGDAPKEEGK